MDRLLAVVLFAQDGVDALLDERADFLLDGDTRHLGFQAAFLAAGADLLVVEEGDVAEFAREAALAVVEFALHDDADGDTAAQMQVEHVVLVLRLAAAVLRIAACAGVVLEEGADTDPLFDDFAHRLLARSEIFVAAARGRIHAARHADAQTEDLAAIHPARGDELLDVGADAVEALRPVEKFERGVHLFQNDVVLQIGDHIAHEIAADVDADEVDRGVGQAVDVGPPSAGGLHLAVVGDDVLLDEFLYQFGDGRHGDMQLLGQLRKRAFAVDGHVGDNVPFDDAVLVRNAFERVIFVFVEKFC